MKNIIVVGFIGLLLFKPALAINENRNYPFRLAVASFVAGGVGLGVTFTTLFAGSDYFSSSEFKFKNENWKNAFYAGLGLDGLSLLLLGTAFVFACCKIGYTPIDDGDF